MRATMLVLIAVLACKRDDATIGKTPEKPKTGKIKKTSPVPEKHRAEHAKCQVADTAAPKTTTFKPMAPQPPGPPCSTRSDCKAGKGARCAAGHCIYDQCYEDGDCKAVCECIDHTEHGTGGHFCRQGNCSIDADCGSDNYCSPTFGFSCGSYSGVVGYYCHTNKDECLNDGDCHEAGTAYGYCAYDTEKGHWRCGYAECDG
jgi:hypothetical protein